MSTANILFASGSQLQERWLIRRGSELRWHIYIVKKEVDIVIMTSRDSFCCEALIWAFSPTRIIREERPQQRNHVCACLCVQGNGIWQKRFRDFMKSDTQKPCCHFFAFVIHVSQNKSLLLCLYSVDEPLLVAKFELFISLLAQFWIWKTLRGLDVVHTQQHSWHLAHIRLTCG